MDYRYPDVSPSYYDVAPLFVSSRGYGLLLDQTEDAVFRLDSDAEEFIIMTESGVNYSLTRVAPSLSMIAFVQAGMNHRTTHMMTTNTTNQMLKFAKSPPSECPAKMR